MSPLKTNHVNTTKQNKNVCISHGKYCSYFHSHKLQLQVHAITSQKKKWTQLSIHTLQLIVAQWYCQTAPYPTPWPLPVPEHNRQDDSASLESSMSGASSSADSSSSSSSLSQSFIPPPIMKSSRSTLHVGALALELSEGWNKNVKDETLSSYIKLKIPQSNQSMHHLN